MGSSDNETRSGKVKVLVIAGSLPPMYCGVGDYAHKLLIALVGDARLEIGALTSRAASDLKKSADFEVFPVVDEWHWRELPKIMRVVRAWAPDLVHIQYPTFAYSGKGLPFVLPLCMRLAAIPVVQTWHEIYSGVGFYCLNFAPGGLILVRKHDFDHFSAQRRWGFFKRTVRYIPIASAVPSVTLSDAERQSIRSKYARPDGRLIVYFGFLYASKGVELIFQIANSEESSLVIIGDAFSEEDIRSFPEQDRRSWSLYPQKIKQLSECGVWKGRVSMTGFLPASDVARIICAADAVILPFIDGGGEGKSTIHAAQAQGTFLLTTSNQIHGYDQKLNTYFSRPNDLEDMRKALKEHIGRRVNRGDVSSREWLKIRESHVDIYRSQLSSSKALT
jgi:glycosyltransferase involved in cell wall biosynthesis